MSSIARFAVRRFASRRFSTEAAPAPGRRNLLPSCPSPSPRFCSFSRHYCHPPPSVRSPYFEAAKKLLAPDAQVQLTISVLSWLAKTTISFTVGFYFICNLSKVLAQVEVDK